MFTIRERYKSCKIDEIYSTISKGMAPKKKTVNLRTSPRKKRTRLPSPEPPQQLDLIDVEDTEEAEIEGDIGASERDSSISRSDTSDDGAATATATTAVAVSQYYSNK